METLGLSGPPAPRDSFFRRIFWPNNDSADADMLGQQGFWICLIVALFSALVSALQGHPLLGIPFAIFYCVGGIGVREHDVPAAIAVAVVYLVNIAGGAVITKQFPGFLSLFIAAILIANIRGCRIASNWFNTGDPDLIPMRMNETWQDKLVDQLPARIWPRIRIAFYVLSVIVLLLTLTGLVVTLLHPPTPPSDSVSVTVRG